MAHRAGRLSGVHNKPLMLSSHKVMTAAPPKPLRSFCFATCPLYTAPDLTSFFSVFQKQAAASVRWFSAVLVPPTASPVTRVPIRFPVQSAKKPL